MQVFLFLGSCLMTAYILILQNLNTQFREALSPPNSYPPLLPMISFIVVLNVMRQNPALGSDSVVLYHRGSVSLSSSEAHSTLARFFLAVFLDCPSMVVDLFMYLYEYMYEHPCICIPECSHPGRALSEIRRGCLIVQNWSYRQL